MTRAEHLEWCKTRAIQCLDDKAGVVNAVSSMLSDLGKHPYTAPLAGIGARICPQYAGIRDVETIRRWIEGFQ